MWEGYAFTLSVLHSVNRRRVFFRLHMAINACIRKGRGVHDLHPPLLVHLEELCQRAVCTSFLNCYLSFPQAYGSLSSKEEMMLFNVIEEHKSSLLVPGGRGSELDWFPWLRFIMRDVHNELMKIVNSHWFVFDSLLQRKKVSKLKL